MNFIPKMKNHTNLAGVSKTEIVCLYCSKEMRKDNLTRHMAKLHPGKKESFSLKTLKGQKSLSSMFSDGRNIPGKALRISESESTDYDLQKSMDIDCISNEAVDFQAKQVYVDLVANEPGKVHQVITVSENNNEIPCSSLTETQKEVINDCNYNFSSNYPQSKKKDCCLTQIVLFQSKLQALL